MGGRGVGEEGGELEAFDVWRKAGFGWIRDLGWVSCGTGKVEAGMWGRTGSGLRLVQGELAVVVCGEVLCSPKYRV